MAESDFFPPIEWRARDTRFFRGQSNFIKRAVLHPCARPWYVYVETFFPAFVELAITVTLFDIEDAIRSHGEKIVAEGRGGGRRRGRHAPKFRISTKELGIARYALLGLRTILIVTKPLELIGFTWLLFSAVDDFFYNWMTLLEKSDFCTQPIESGPLTRSRGPGFISILPGGAPVGLATIDQNRGAWATSQITATLPQGLFTCIWALTVIGPANGVDDVRVQLRITGNLGPSLVEMDPIDIGPGEQVDLLMIVEFFLFAAGGGSIVWEIAGQAIPVGIESVKGHMAVWRTG